MSRAEDERRVMAAFKRVTLTCSQAGRAVGTISEIVDLIEDIRHETAEECRAAMLGGVTLKMNSYMTPERLRRLLATPAPGKARDDE